MRPCAWDPVFSTPIPSSLHPCIPPFQAPIPANRGGKKPTRWQTSLSITKASWITKPNGVQVMDEALVDLRVNHATPVVFSDQAAATFPRSTLVLNLGRWMDKVRELTARSHKLLAVSSAFRALMMGAETFDQYAVVQTRVSSPAGANFLAC